MKSKKYDGRNRENQNTVNNILLILKCYIYIGVDVRGESPHLHGGLQFLKYYIKIELLVN